MGKPKNPDSPPLLSKSPSFEFWTFWFLAPVQPPFVLFPRFVTFLVGKSSLSWIISQIINRLKDYLINLQRVPFKKCQKKWKSTKGGAMSTKNSIIKNVNFSRWGGEVWIFSFWPNINVNFQCFIWPKNRFVLKRSLGNFKCFKLFFPKFQIYPISKKAKSS